VWVDLLLTAEDTRAWAGWAGSRAPAPARLAFIRARECITIDRLHVKHGLYGSSGCCRIEVTEHLGQPGGHHLPGDAVFVLEPAALLGRGLPARRELLLVIVHFCLRLAMDLERSGLLEREHRAAVEGGKRLPIQLAWGVSSSGLRTDGDHGDHQLVVWRSPRSTRLDERACHDLNLSPLFRREEGSPPAMLTTPPAHRTVRLLSNPAQPHQSTSFCATCACARGQPTCTVRPQQT
jgi:hypothetical protein